MKSSINTSMISTGFYGMFGCREFEIITTSNLFQGIVVSPLTRSEMMSLAVSDPANKNGGDFHHPICNAVDTTSSVYPRETCRQSATGST